MLIMTRVSYGGTYGERKDWFPLHPQGRGFSSMTFFILGKLIFSSKKKTKQNPEYLFVVVLFLLRWRIFRTCFEHAEHGRKHPVHVYAVFKFSTISVLHRFICFPGGTHNYMMSGSVGDGEREWERGGGGVCVMFYLSRWIKEVG